MFEVSRNQHLTRVDKWHFHVSLLRHSEILAASHRSSQESEQSDQSDHVWAIKKSIKHIEEATRKPCITDCRSNPGSFLSERLPKPPSSMLQSACCLPHAGNATYLFATHRGFWQPTTILVGKTGQFLLLPCQFLPKLGFLPYFCHIFFGSNHTSAGPWLFFGLLRVQLGQRGTVGTGHFIRLSDRGNHPIGTENWQYGCVWKWGTPPMK